MRHWLPLCAMIVIVSGCVASRSNYDGPALPRADAGRTEKNPDEAVSAGTIPAFPLEEKAPAASEDVAAADGPTKSDALQHPESNPGAEPQCEPFVELKTFVDGGKFSGGRMYLIEWKCGGFSGINAELFVEFYDGRGWRCLWRGEPTESKFNWHLPNIDSVYCKIRVRAVDGALSRTTTSQSFFIIERTATDRTATIEIDDEQTSDDVVVVEPTVKQFAPEGEEADSGQPDPASETAALLAQGNEYLSRGEYESAAQAFLKCVACNPADIEALYGLGQAYYHAGRFAEAREVLLRATALMDDHADAHYCLGRIAMKLAATAADPAAERQNARRRFLKAIMLNPKYDAAYNDLGKVCFDGGEIEDAYLNFRKAVECDGGNKIYLYNAGRAAYALGQRESCVEYCKRAIEVDAKFRYPCWLAARSCSELQRWDEAVSYWAIAAELFSFDEKMRAEALGELQKAREALASGGE